MNSGNSSQNCTYTVKSGCKSRANAPKINPDCTYTVRLGCESRASVPKLYPNLIEALVADEFVVIWQGDGRLLTNLETREANKQDRRPKKRAVRQAEYILVKSKKFYIKYSGVARREKYRDAITTF